uniref:Poly(A) polymerase catalytic subunit domain-containing protein n=1 Tax=viral metagenome TaxID=1070528 RepID=A0A6C0KT41_9ZZZZ
MESEIEHLPSDLLDTDAFKIQLDRIKQASEMAQQKLDYYSAHDDQVLLSISIVEKFLKKKHRICYGGQAINAYLPAKYKFYHPETSIPDYDFFTPSHEADIEEITTALIKSGFEEISVREGMHEGTLKIYVNFIPVADLTVIDPKLYRLLSKRASRIDEITYLDANSLRMLMYLELSRPRGEVGRWQKVFERLMLFNEFVSVKDCIPDSVLLKNKLTLEQVQFTIDYIIKEKRLFAGADLLSFYETSMLKKSRSTQWIVSHKKPILFLSSNARDDAKYILSEFQANQDNKIKIKFYSYNGLDYLPGVYVLHESNQPLVIIIQQAACHSYYTLPVKKKQSLRIATLDTLITLYFSLGFINTSFFSMDSMECLANHFVQLSIKGRKMNGQFVFPFISINCSGHQTTLPSLIRAKVKRVTEKKKRIKNMIKRKTLSKRRL